MVIEIRMGVTFDCKEVLTIKKNEGTFWGDECI